MMIKKRVKNFSANQKKTFFHLYATPQVPPEVTT